MNPTSSSDSESQEESKGDSGSCNDKNSLMSLKLEEVAPAGDVYPAFFGSRKTAEGDNRYEKIQVGFKSCIPLEHEIKEGGHTEFTKRKQDYRMDINFDNISKVQWF